jgi:Tol biopolymer transport system component
MRRGIVVSIAAGALLLFAVPAAATFPGKNGKIAMTGYEQRFGSFFNPRIFTSNLDGNDFTLLITSGSGGEPTTPSWSPDGQKIAFETGFIYRDIYTMNADGTGVTQITRHHMDVAPAWSPDGTKIVFSRVTLQPGNEDLYTMNADGSAVAKLTDGGSQPVWSPSGDLIAFSSGQIEVISPNGTGRRTLNPGTFPDWSPDGRRIVFESGGEIHAINPDGTGPVQLTDDSSPDPLTTISNQNPAWSPDGTQIAYVHAACNYEAGPDFCSASLETVNADGSGNRTTHPVGGFEPAWQPLPIPAPKRADYKNAAHYCKALREFLGDAAFLNKFGGGANVHGKCVSANH